MSRVLLSPAEVEGGGGVVENTASSTETAPVSTGGLNADQQKIAAALDKQVVEPTTEKKTTTPPRVHKSIFKPAPADVLDKELGGDLDELGNVVEVVPIVKKDDTTTTKVVADKDKKVVEVVKPTVVDPTKRPVDVIDPTKSKQFDYTGFDHDETALLKQMSNPAREFTAKIIRELKTIKTQQPQAFYQHPDAYTLLPGYRENQKALSFATMELNHWKQQLIRIRRGEDFIMLKGFDDSGKAVYGDKVKASEEADIDISNGLQQLMVEQQRIAGKQEEFKRDWGETVKRDDAVLQQQRAERFAWNKDAKLLEEKVELPGVGEVSVKQIRDEFGSWFAPYHRTNPLFELMKDMFAGLQIYGAKIRALENNNVTEKKLREDVLRAEPSPETVAAGKSEGVEFDTKGMDD